MKNELKDIIANAKQYRREELYSLYVIDSGKKYNGFYGVTGYNNIIVIGVARKKEADENEYYLLTNWSDVVRVTDIKSCSVEISTKLGCVCLFFDEPIIVPIMPILSTCMLESAKKKKNES